MTERLERKVLIIGGGPGGRVSYMALRRMGLDSIVLVANEEPTVICSLPYSVGRELIPDGPDEVVVDMAQSDRLPPDMKKDVLQGVVLSLDPEGHSARVQTSSGETEILFEKAILAPGAVPWVPPVEGVIGREDRGGLAWFMHGKELVSRTCLARGVYIMRGAEDARELDRFAGPGRRAIVVGSGAIGLEIVEALVQRGTEVTVVEALPHVTAALDEDLAARIEARLEEQGVRVLKDVQLAAVTGEGARLSDGSAIGADAVVFATGVRANTDLAARAGLTVRRGIVADSRMRTSHPDVFAVGDAAELTDGPTGQSVLPFIGTLAMRQAIVAVSNIMGREMELPPATPWGLSAIFGLHWGSVGWTSESASAAGFQTACIDLDYNTMEPYMPSSRKGIWRLVVAAAPAEGVLPGQILGFEVVMDGKSPLFLAERFLDIITGRETVQDLFRHYFIHSPAHNDVNDPYLQLIFKAQELFSRRQ